MKKKSEGSEDKAMEELRKFYHRKKDEQNALYNLLKELEKKTIHKNSLDNK